jgi:hypothetical protein
MKIQGRFSTNRQRMVTGDLSSHITRPGIITRYHGSIKAKKMISGYQVSLVTCPRMINRSNLIENRPKIITSITFQYKPPKNDH